jgi:hypothetical protein
MESVDSFESIVRIHQAQAQNPPACATGRSGKFRELIRSWGNFLKSTAFRGDFVETIVSDEGFGNYQT